MLRRALYALVFLELWFTPTLAQPKKERVIPTVFFIAKSSNRNQVHYGLHVDEHCKPVGKRPAFEYWKDFEVSATATSKLSSLEQNVYGISSQKLSKGNTKDSYRMRLRIGALPKKIIDVIVRQEESACKATAYTRIHGKSRALHHIYLELSGIFNTNVDALELHAQRSKGKKPIVEILHP